MAQHNLLGNKGEMLASRYLLDKGYAVLHYNWRAGHKEIDLIAKERDTLVFVEVKSRTSEQYGNAWDAVTDDKMRLAPAFKVKGLGAIYFAFPFTTD